MHNNKLIIIFSIMLCIIFSFAACKRDNLEKKKDNASKNPNVQESSPPKTAEPTPAPKESSKKNSTNKNSTNKNSSNEQSNKTTVVASFNTTIIDYDENRINNIRLAAAKVNDYILKPNGVFSFNKVVGKREYEKGYRKAAVLVQGEKDEDIGGGVCQLSSTIYNAALQSGLKIIERHSHSGDVHYVPKGQDAAVSYGAKDLKFKNTKGYPIRFRVTVNNGKVSVSILKAGS